LSVNRPPRYDSIQPASIGGALKSNGARQGAFNGYLDEVRIENVARSPEWIRTCYLMVISNDWFITYGVETPEMTVRGKGCHIVNGDSTPDTSDGTDFGVLAVAGATHEHSFSIENEGRQNLLFTGTPLITITGHTSDFSVSTNVASTNIATGGSTSFTIKFDPTVAGTRTGVVSIANNDTNRNPYTFCICGSGAAASLSYSSRMFYESADNDGSVSNSVAITLVGDTFSQNSGMFTQNVHYTAANVPAGLSPVISVTDNSHLELSLNGNAVFHQNANDATNMTITFLDAAFVTCAASDVTSYSRSDIVVDFKDNPMPQVSFGVASTVERFGAAVSNMNLSGADPNPQANCSGCCVMPSTGELLVIRNNPAQIQVYDMNGTYKNRFITLNGFDDTEGICLVDSNRNLFVISEERTGTVVVVTITSNTTSITRSGNPIYQTTIGSTLNVGIEGITYDLDNDCFYAVKEKNSMQVCRITTNGTGSTTALFDAGQVLNGVCTDLADLFYDRYSRHLFLLSQESEKVIECDLAGGIIAQFSIGMFTQPEGICLTPDGHGMCVVGEPNEFVRFERQPISSITPENTVTNIPVVLSWPAATNASVDFAVTSSTAIANQDYLATNGTLNFMNGATQGTISVTILSDPEIESVEELQITLTNAANVFLGADSEYRLSIADSTFAATLTVYSVRGVSVPSVGEHTYGSGTNLTCALTNSPITGVATQYVCAGWSMAGCSPLSGTTTNFTMALTNNAGLTWLWGTNYWLDTGVSGSGRVDVAGGWIGRNLNVTVSAIASDNRHLEG